MAELVIAEVIKTGDPVFIHLDKVYKAGGFLEPIAVGVARRDFLIGEYVEFAYEFNPISSSVSLDSSEIYY